MTPTYPGGMTILPDKEALCTKGFRVATCDDAALLPDITGHQVEAHIGQQP